MVMRAHSRTTGHVFAADAVSTAMDCGASEVECGHPQEYASEEGDARKHKSAAG